MSDDYEPISATLLVETFDLLLELVEAGHKRHATRLLHALRERVLIDDAMLEKADMLGWYGADLIQ